MVGAVGESRRLQRRFEKGAWCMPEVVVRKKIICVEEIFHEGGPVAEKPLRRAAALAVIRNPFAGSYVANIEGFMDDLKPLGLEMARKLVDALGGDPEDRRRLWQGRDRGIGAEKSSTEPCGMCRADTRCARCWAERRRLWHRRKK